MKNLALIVAAGSGRRFGGELPKQYAMLGGKPVLQHSIDTFLSHPDIDGVMVVISKEYEELFNFNVPYCFGGAERQDSVRLGLEALEKTNPQNVLIHDAARPFISHKVIDNVLEGLRDNKTAIPTIKAIDSIRVAGKAVERSKVDIIQTPQGFRFEAILKAHNAQRTTHNATDDASVAESAGLELHFVEGDAMNKKITNQADITHNAQRITRIGQGFDVHAFEAGDSVTICGVKIPHNKKLKGHSDADVGLHAITDAILGAIGAGDIGEHFPPSDAKWKGVDSAVFLKHAASLAKNSMRGEIQNIDVTIICEEPKITPHKPAMKKRIAEILEIAPERVNVKATTTEGLGFTGRREGIAAQAVATIGLIG